MEEEVKQSKTAVNANAKPAEPMTKGAPYEDLGGPTPENYSPTNDSAKLKEPGGSLKQVSDAITNRKGKMKAEESEVEITDEQEVVVEDELTTDEVVAEEETVEETVEIDVEDDVNALLGGEELSEEFRAKAKTIFEAAINSKVAVIREEIVREHEEKLSEEVEEIKVELQERVDSYLEYVADEWFVENQLAVENGLKADMTESFLEGMKGLFEEHYVQIPEEKYDVLKSMVEKLDDMETKLNEQIEKNITLNKSLAEATADGILESVSDGLAATQKEKLASLAESVEFESDEEYREKLETLKESYFPHKGAPTAKTENLSEGVDNAEGLESHTASMTSYLKTLSAFKN
tara:strand:- start:92 stop:1138 length:1047 start_codon:yes stop_codon:yes gene_type:complete